MDWSRRIEVTEALEVLSEKVPLSQRCDIQCTEREDAHQGNLLPPG